MMNSELKTLALIFPAGIFDWFEIVGSVMDKNEISIIFEEKNIPPLTEADKAKEVVAKGFSEITVTDFPIRGRKTLLTFRRRYWQIEGEKTYLKRDIQLTFPGTQLATEFANFLKAKSRNQPDVARQYRRYLPPGSEGV